MDEEEDDLMMNLVGIDPFAAPVRRGKKKKSKRKKRAAPERPMQHAQVQSLPRVNAMSEFEGAPVVAEEEKPEESKKRKFKGKGKITFKKLEVEKEEEGEEEGEREEEEEKTAPAKKKKKKRIQGARPPAAPIEDDEVRVLVDDALFDEESSFVQLGLGERCVSALERSHPGHTKPTRVQSASIPAFLGGRDVLLRGKTGTGKTLSFVLPIIDQLSRIEPRVQRSQGTYAIIITPTRELAVQIVEECQSILMKFAHWVVSGQLIGGEKRKSEKARLRKGVHLLVATPGRLLDHLQSTHAFFIRNLRYLVFDEADRLLDMGFEHDIRNIVEELKRRKRTDVVPQTMLASATLWDGVRRLAAISLTKPLYVNAAPAKEGAADEDAVYDGQYDQHQRLETPSALKQHYVIVPCKERLAALAAFLRWQMSKSAKVMVFFSSCDSVDFMFTLLSNVRLQLEDEDRETAVLGDHATVQRLHGKMTQLDRLSNFHAFRASKCGVMLCTDAAARGIDVHDLSWVVQYDPPPEPKEYVHRVGRTARIGHSGNALLFLLPSEAEYISLMSNHGLEMVQISLERLMSTLELVAFSRVDGVSSVQKMLQLLFERFVLQEREVKEQATRAFLSFVRAYATHANKQIFHTKMLHLGHVSKSFALRDAPTQLLGAFRKKFSHNNYMTERQAEQQQERERFQEMKQKERAKLGSAMSEFATGF